MSLRPISVEYLVPGMRVNGDIYGSNQGVFVLVTKNAVLTESMIRRLQTQLQVTRNIYVTDETYTKLMEIGLPKSLSQKNLEEKTGYNHLKNTAANIIKHTIETGKIDIGKTEEAVLAISEKVKSKENMAILQCINGVREVDEYLYQHSMNVSFLNGLIAKWMGLSEEEVHAVATVGILHDTGKVKIPPEILQKPGKLTEEEFEEMKAHPLFSLEIMKESGIKDDKILQGALQHHEKTNGRGYPEGVSGEKISLYAKITAVSDVYDAMVAKRVYKQEQSPFLVLEMFSRSKVSDLDIEIVTLFLEKMPSELINKRVLLSDGSIGEVVFIDTKNYANPIVNVDGNIISTGKEISVMRMVV